jgi:hypothetical protein
MSSTVDEGMLRMILEGLQKGTLGELLEPFASSSSTPPELQAVVEKANLRPEQTAVFNILMGLRGGANESDGDVIDIDAEPDALLGLRQELADLREVNDTVAKALGACRVCWGGDADCAECAGAGRPGSIRPDPALFERLVIPAVRRVRAPMHATGHEWTRRGRHRGPEAGGR